MVEAVVDVVDDERTTRATVPRLRRATADVRDGSAVDDVGDRPDRDGRDLYLQPDNALAGHRPRAARIGLVLDDVDAPRIGAGRTARHPHGSHSAPEKRTSPLTRLPAILLG